MNANSLENSCCFEKGLPRRLGLWKRRTGLWANLMLAMALSDCTLTTRGLATGNEVELKAAAGTQVSMAGGMWRGVRGRFLCLFRY